MRERESVWTRYETGKKEIMRLIRENVKDQEIINELDWRIEDYASDYADYIEACQND